MLDLLDITKELIEKWIEELPRRNYYEDLECESLIIVPSGRIHDSGFKCMNFIALDKHNLPICVHSTGSDVIHFNGFGGYGEYNENYGKIFPQGDWKIDLLPCGYFRIFRGGYIKLGRGLSDFDIYTV